MCPESAWEPRRRTLALDCRTVRQRGLTSSFRLTSPASKWLTAIQNLMKLILQLCRKPYFTP